jgi:hypothetical protein
LRLLLILLFILPAAAFSQTGNITGTISDNGIPVPFTTVHVEGTKIITQTDSLGRFQLNNVPYGKNNLVISSPEYNKQSFPFELKSPTLVLPEITVKSNNLEEVVFVKTKTELVKEQPFAVESIEPERKPGAEPNHGCPHS